MAFDTQDERSGAMGTFILPLHPDPDGLEFSQADRQQVVGVYPGLLSGEATPDKAGLVKIVHTHHHEDVKYGRKRKNQHGS